MCHHQDPKCFAEVVLCASMLCKSFKCLFAFRDTKQKLEDSEREKSIAEEMRVECQEKLQKLEGDLDEERALNIQLSQTVQSLEDERASNTQLSQANESLERQVKQLQKELRLKEQKLEESLTASLQLTHKLSCTADPQDKEDIETDGCGGVQQLNNIDVLSTSECEATAHLCPISLPAVIEFSSEMTPHWEAIGHGLFIGSSAVQALRNHPCSQDSKCIQMLEKWFENGIDVSWERLFSVLRGQKMMSLISAMSRRAKS
jgi:Skp family chaperone for outer membrane proteins